MILDVLSLNDTHLLLITGRAKSRHPTQTYSVTGQKGRSPLQAALECFQPQVSVYRLVLKD